MNLLPPLPTGTSTPSGTAAPNLTPILIQAINTESLALLNKLLVGDILTGTVLGRGADGQTMIRTDRGIMALAGAIDAVEGSKVTLEVRATGARLQVMVLAIESSGTGAPPVPVQAPRNAPVASQASAPTVELPRPNGGELFATVLRPTVPGANPAAPNPAPTPAATPQVAPSAAASGPAAPILPQPATAPGSLPTQPLPVGQRLALTIAAVVPPDTPDPPPPPAPAFTATVRALTPAGQPIIDTPLGSLAVERALGWPVGTRIVASFQPLPVVPEASPAAPRGWTALHEAAALLNHPDRPDLVAALERVLPRIGPHLAAGLAAWLKLRQDPAEIGGLELKAALAKVGQAELAPRLQAEFAEMARAAPQSEPGWRTVIVPLLDENRLQQAMLSVRRDPPQGKAAERGEPGSVHFLVDVELSRLGPLQFDGLVRGKRLDLMLRTQRPLDAALRLDITEIFQAAQQATGYAGQLFFQAGAPFLKTVAAPRDPGVVA